MKWKTTDCLLALFLCMVFVFVVGYGAFSFGGENMGCFENAMIVFSLIELLILAVFVFYRVWKSGQRILAIALFVVPILCIGVLFYCCRKCPEKEPKVNQMCEALQESCSNSRNISVSNILINCKQGDAK